MALLTSLLTPCLHLSSELAAVRRPPLLRARAHAVCKLDVDTANAFSCMGFNIGRQLSELNVLEEDELDALLAGIKLNLMDDDPPGPLSEGVPRAAEIMRERAMKETEKAAEAGVALLAEAAKEEGAVQTESGLVVMDLVVGEGKAPTAENTVKVHYEGTLSDGTVFDSSRSRGEPIEFPLNSVIKGWTEGLQLMKEGGKAKLTIPSQIAYGERGSPPKIPADNVLVFKMEILGIQGASKPAISCNVATFEDCDEKEKAFVEKIKAKGSAAAELARLEGMKAKPMKSELKSWLDTRVHLLTKMNDEL